jgi:hypothetical protein
VRPSRLARCSRHDRCNSLEQRNVVRSLNLLDPWNLLCFNPHAKCKVLHQNAISYEFISTFTMEIQPTGQSAAFNCFSSDQKMSIEANRMNNSSRPCVLAFLLLLSLPGRVALQVAGASLQKANFLPPSPTSSPKSHIRSHVKSHLRSHIESDNYQVPHKSQALSLGTTKSQQVPPQVPPGEEDKKMVNLMRGSGATNNSRWPSLASGDRQCNETLGAQLSGGAFDCRSKGPHFKAECPFENKF